MHKLLQGKGSVALVSNPTSRIVVQVPIHRDGNILALRGCSDKVICQGYELSEINSGLAKWVHITWMGSLHFLWLVALFLAIVQQQQKTGSKKNLQIDC